MSSNTKIYDYVKACLAAKLIPQKEVAAGSGVPFSTVSKIAQGVVKDPSVHTVQRLYDYFAAQCLPDAFCEQSDKSDCGSRREQQEAA